MILTTEKSAEYELIDSGDGEKLERFGTHIIRRPDPEVLWNKTKPEEIWNSAHAEFAHGGAKGKWKIKEGLHTDWNSEINGIKIRLKIQNFKHIGVFPEQAEQWKWMIEKIKNQKSKLKDEGQEGKEIKILNLFGYTGIASIILAKTGAEVTHVDGAESAIAWAKENASLNDISNIRFITDDARKFVEREIKRGMTYDAVLMDPPVYGKGTKKEVWRIAEDFLPLLARTAELLSNAPAFFTVNGYASEYSHLSYKNALSGGILYEKNVESGELAIKESDTDRLLPAGIFARASF